MFQSMNIAGWVKQWRERHPKKDAILYEGEKITYLDLHLRMSRTGCWLQSLGIEKGDRVAVMLDNSPEFIDLYLACSAIGAVFVPVNTRLSGGELSFILEDSGPKLLVFGSRFGDIIESVNPSGQRPSLSFTVVGDPEAHAGIPDYITQTSAFEGEAPSFAGLKKSLDPEDPQIIMYTSGTTGQPKGAILPHRKLFFNCLNGGDYFGLNFNDTMLVVLPLFHSGGLVIQVSPTLYYGATMIIHPRFNPVRVFQDIEHFRVTKFLGVPTVFRSLLKVEPDKRGDLSSLEIVTIGGEKVPLELIEQCKEAGFPIRQVMGQTETSIFLWASEEDLVKKPGSVGRPVFHGDVAVLDEDGEMVKPGEVGQLVVGGATMMTAYWHDPARTRETIKDGWLYAGDLARVDDEGYFFLVDRAMDMYISGGENVYPAEVEKVLRAHPGVEEVAVVGIPDETWGETGEAFVIPRPGSELSSEDLISFCEGKLAHYKWPKKVTFCQDFPRTSLGKIIKSQLIQKARP